MKKLLLALAACGVLVSACGQKQEATPSESTASGPAAIGSSPAASTPVEPATPAGEPAAAVNDGETVEEAALQVSPVAAAIAANAPVPQAPLAGGWVEGKHYKALAAPQPTSAPAGMIEVVEIFWYGCGHCYHLAPSLESWSQKGKPAFVKLTYLPVIWNPVTREDARVFYTLDALGKIEALQSAVFRETHVNGNPLTVISGNQVDTAATEKKVREFMLKNGVSAEDFGRTYRSFAVENKLRSAEVLVRRYMADHTPMFVINGRWSTDVTMAGGPEPLLRLIGDLATSERGR